MVQGSPEEVPVTDGYASSHRKVIAIIHKTWFDGRPFAIWEVRDATSLSTSTVVRVLRPLVRLRLLARAKRGYRGRHYRVAKAWPLRLVDAIQTFEFAMMLKLAE